MDDVIIWKLLSYNHYAYFACLVAPIYGLRQLEMFLEELGRIPIRPMAQYPH